MEEKTKKCKHCKSEIPADAKVCPQCRKKQGGGKLKWVAIIIVVLIVISVATSGGGTKEKQSADINKSSGTTQPQSNASSDQTTPDASTPEPTAPVTEHFETDLPTGHYTAGVDIPAGTYNVTAISGKGNVSSSNMYSGGLNELMGVPADDMYNESFNNLKLPEGEVLSLSNGVTVHIVSEDAQTGSMKSRVIGSEVQTDLAAGNYVAGTDFPAGVYNIVSTGGTGNVSSDNMYDGGLNEIMGDGSDGYSIKQVNNVSLTEGVTLTLSGANVQLVPVGSAE